MKSKNNSIISTVLFFSTFLSLTMLGCNHPSDFPRQYCSPARDFCTEKTSGRVDEFVSCCVGATELFDTPMTQERALRVCELELETRWDELNSYLPEKERASIRSQVHFQRRMEACALGVLSAPHPVKYR